MLAEAEYGMTDFALRENAAYEADAKLLVHFDMRPHMDKVKSKAEGRPIFVPREYITIHVPGDKNNVVCHPVSDLDRRRFPRQYARFKANEQQSDTGTPLETVPWITREQVEELKYFKVRTLEALADLSDGNLQKFHGIQKLKQKAADQIARAKMDAPAAKLQEELRARDLKISQQEKLLTELSAKVEALSAKK
jgi:hypothetical protein